MPLLSCWLTVAPALYPRIPDSWKEDSHGFPGHSGCVSRNRWNPVLSLKFVTTRSKLEFGLPEKEGDTERATGQGDSVSTIG